MMIVAFLPFASGALLGSAYTCSSCREQSTRGQIAMQASRRFLLSAAAASVLVPSRAWAGYALQSANQNQHTWDATDKAKELAVYESIRSSIDAKRPDRPDVGTLGYVGGEYTKESSRSRQEFEQQLAGEQSMESKKSGYARPEDILGGAARMTVSPRTAQFK
mmetsp:Transcript_8508/g.17124  ORF Transcript_8508/g.17124 Transcript_8508/m.17124 type:complete len:163 (-) Transcript_8508:281-769(-)